MNQFTTGARIMSIAGIFGVTMAGLVLFATTANAQTAQQNTTDAALVDRVKDAVVKELRESGAIDRAVDAGIALSLHGAIDRLPACSNRECPTAMNKPSLLHSRVCRVGRRCDNDRHEAAIVTGQISAFSYWLLQAFPAPAKIGLLPSRLCVYLLQRIERIKHAT